jgi:S1-C subfamily serine protease
LLSLPAALNAGQFEESGRNIVGRHEKSVVAVKLTVKESMNWEGQSSRKQDAILDVTGTCIDPSGLTVVSLRTIDRTEMMGSFGMGGEDGFKSRFESEISDAVIILPGTQTEIPAKVVLRDKDLDLAFLRPSQKTAKPFDFINLSEAVQLKMLDQFFILDRMPKEEGRAPVIVVSRVGAVLEKPRKFYVSADLMASMTLGSPAFNSDGKAVGLVVYKISPGGRKKEAGMPKGPIPGVIPAADILDVAKQVPAEKN